MSTSRVAVVTGAASGLGAGIAAALSNAGWLVAGIDLRPSSTDLGCIADVTDAAAVATAMREIRDTLGPISALVTAAGVYEELTIEAITDERWDRMFSINVGGTVNTCAAAIPYLAESAGLSGSGSAIVTISSDLGLGGSQGDAHYSATKGAIVGFSRGLARELADQAITVNSVAPGAADTPLLAADSPWRGPEFLSTLPLPRLVSPAEIAAAVLFFLEMGPLMTGQIVSPNSGATI